MARTMMADPLARHREEGERWPTLRVVAAFIAGFTLMTWPWLLGLQSIPWDAKATFLPQVQFLAQSLWRGEAPWWNAYVFSGMPQVADPQSMLFSPPFLLLALVNPSPGPWAGDLTVLASMCLGGIGLILWFRDRGWHWAGALIAALAFTFGAAMAWRIQHWGQVLTMAYLPWVLLFLDRAVERASWWSGAMAGLVAAFLVLGRDQISLLCVYLLLARVVWLWAGASQPGEAFRGSIGPLALGGMAGLAIVTLPVLMTAFLAGESNRPAIDFAGAGAGSLHPALLTTFVIPQVFSAASAVPDAFWGPPSFTWIGTGLYTAQNVGQSYIGAVPVLAIVGAAAAGRLWDRDVRFFAVAFVLVLLYALGWYTPLFKVAHSVLPGINLYRRPADAVFLFGGLGAILAGYAVHVWFVEPWRRPGWPSLLAVTVLIVAAFAAALVFAHGKGRLHQVPLALAEAAGWLALAAGAIAWAMPRVALTPWLACLGLALVTAADLGFNNGPNSSSALPPRTFEVLEPGSGNPVIAALRARVVDDATRRDRVELSGLGFHWPNASMTHNLENTLGYNPVRLGIYSRATGAEDHVGLPEQRKFSPLFPSYASPLADMLGLRWIATGVPIEKIDKHLPPGRLALVARPDGAYIYENPHTLPRVVFARDAQAASFERLIETGRWPDFDPRSTVLLEKPVGAEINRLPGKAQLISYRQNRIEIEATSPTGGWVVLHDIWHPWWFAEVDGRPAAILQANVLFRAVYVAAGTHRIVMTFQPLTGLAAEIRTRLARGRLAAGK